MLDSIKPGQTIRCTIVKEPVTHDDRSTVSRLMRNDPEIKRRLKGAQEYRMKNLYVRSRGLRPWEVRRPASLHALPIEGASWTMRWFPQIAGDFRAVESFLKIEKA